MDELQENKAEVERMRPVVDAAIAWRHVRLFGEAGNSDLTSSNQALSTAVGHYQRFAAELISAEMGEAQLTNVDEILKAAKEREEEAEAYTKAQVDACKEILNKQRELAEARPPFVKELEDLINRYSLENESDTPDFILAQHLKRTLDLLAVTITRREVWYGRGAEEQTTEDIGP